MRRTRLIHVSAISLAAILQVPGAFASPLVPRFVEETASSGVNSVYAGEWEYMVGGGVATFDCNDDGFPDMVLAGGEAPAKFYRNTSTRGGALKFSEDKSGLELDKVTGAYPLDVDGDGKMDVMLLRQGENVLMRGQGSCQFARANEAWGFEGGDAWSAAFSATWEKGEPWPTLAVGNYIDRNEEISPWGSCTDNWLQRPAPADGKSERRFAPPLALKPSYCALSMLFTDWNRSGAQSLRISNDREYYEGGQEQLWKIEPGKPPSLFTDKDGWKPLKIWGMGVAGADLDGDGYNEYFLTSMADNKLQKVAPPATGSVMPPTYKDVAYSKGLTAHRPYTGGDLKPSTAWHAQFDDVNNDGRLDLFIAKGNVDSMPDFAARDPNNLLLQAEDGKFIEAGDAAGIASFAHSRGASLVDFNLDGLLDLVVVNRWQSAKVWRNVSEKAGNWIGLRLEEDGPNRNAIGAWIEVTRDGVKSDRELTVGGGHASGQAGWLHLGLGEAKDAELRVLWPDGTRSEPFKLAAGQFYVVRRNSSAPDVFTPRN